MKKIFTSLQFLTLCLAVQSTGSFFAQNELAIYNFNGSGQETCSNRIVAPASTPTPNANVTFGNFTVMNVSCVATANQFNNDTWNTSASIDLTEYVEFTMTADANFEINIDSLYFDLRSSQLGGVMHVRSSLDNYASDMTGFQYFDGTNWLPVTTFDIPDAYLTYRNDLDASFSGLSAITFRFYATNVLAASTTIRLDNVIPYGNTSASSNNINENEVATFSISPNPGTNVIHINIDSNDKIEAVNLLDQFGKVVLTNVSDLNTDLNFETENLSSGIYFVEVISSAGKATQRWIKL